MSVFISNLPSYTGSAADLRWFVMNDSGETTTYKYSGYTSPFKSVGTTNKIIKPVDDKALLEIGSGNTFNTYSGSNLKNALVVGNGNNADGVADTPVVFIGNNLDSQQFGSYALHIGNNHYASGSYNLSIGDSGIEQNASYSVLIGRGGGIQSHKTWGSDVYNMGQSNQLQGITGGFSFGKNHTISNGQWGGIFGGIGNTISSSGNYNTILGGESNTITGGTNVIGIGLSGRTGLSQDNTTYVENIHTFKTETFSVVDAGSVGGSINVDLSQGTLYKFSMTANTTPNFINWKEGQRITFVVENTSTYTVPTMTITGGGSVLAKGGGVNPTNNGITKYTGVIISGDLYLNEELDFQAL